jgi:predicted secreted protein
MPIQTPLAVAIYFTIWWIALFAILPLGVRSQHEDEAERPEGSDPGAPVAPLLWKKAGITTVVSAVLFALFLLIVKFYPQLFE